MTPRWAQFIQDNPEKILIPGAMLGGLLGGVTADEDAGLTGAVGKGAFLGTLTGAGSLLMGHKPYGRPWAASAKKLADSVDHKFWMPGLPIPGALASIPGYGIGRLLDREKDSSGWVPHGSQQWVKDVGGDAVPSEQPYQPAGKTYSKRLKRFGQVQRQKRSNVDELLASAGLTTAELAPSMAAYVMDAERLESDLGTVGRLRADPRALLGEADRLMASQRTGPMASNILGVNLFARPLLSKMLMAKEEGDLESYDQASSQLLGGMKALAALDAVDTLDTLGMSERIQARMGGEIGEAVREAALGSARRRLAGSLGTVAAVGALARALRPRSSGVDEGSSGVRAQPHVVPELAQQLMDLPEA